MGIRTVRLHGVGWNDAARLAAFDVMRDDRLFMHGLTCCAAPLLVLGIALLALSQRAIRASETPSQRALEVWRFIGLILSIAGLIAAAVFEPFFKPGRYLTSVEERAAPLIQAIDAYDARHGAPPQTLDVLVPELLERIPSSGFRGNADYSYEYVSSITQPRWRLTVWVGGLTLLDDSCFYFDSWTRRWGYSAH